MRSGVWVLLAGLTVSGAAWAQDCAAPYTSDNLLGALVEVEDKLLNEDAAAALAGAEGMQSGLACLNEFTGSDGSFAFADVAADWHSFEIVATDSSRATVLVPVQLGAEEVFSLDVNVPDLDAASSMPSSPTEVEMGEGLLLTISGGDIEPPLFVDPATEVAGVRVPQADWIPVIGATEVVDQWFLAPYHHKAVNGGLPIRFENLWKLKDGTSYEVWVASYDDSAWHSAGTVTVGGGFLEGGVLIDEVSTVALVVP